MSGRGKAFYNFPMNYIALFLDNNRLFAFRWQPPSTPAGMKACDTVRRGGRYEKRWSSQARVLCGRRRIVCCSSLN